MMDDQIIGRIRSYYEPMSLKRRLYFRAKIRFAKIMEQVERLLPMEGTIVNLGCGAGLFDIYMKLRAPKRRIIGFDTDRWKMETLLRQTADLGIDFRVLDVNEAEIPPADAILLYDVIHHIAESGHEALFRRCRDALNDGGILVIKDVELKGFLGTLIPFTADHLNRIISIGADSVINFIPPDRVLGVLERAGFRAEITRPEQAGAVRHLIYRAVPA